MDYSITDALSPTNCSDNKVWEVIKSSFLSNGKPRYKCNHCGRQFVEDPQKSRISEETKVLIDKLLLERLLLAGMVRVMGVSKRWLPYYINDKYEKISQEVLVKKKAQAT
jgi:insertion element IS1 protein InsB